MTTNRRRGRRWATAAAVVLAVAGVWLITVAVRAQQAPPQPPASAARAVQVTPTAAAHRCRHHHRHHRCRITGHRHPRAGARGPARGEARRVIGPTLPRSRPVFLSVPAIGVHSVLKPLGLNSDGTVEVPPLSKNSYAGWYKNSPTPGQQGPALILGHVDSAAYGPGVFFRLGDMRQRDRIFVRRADGTVAVFEVQRVVEYSKAHFPTLQVYGNTRRAALRLITCGGTFDFSQRSYESNIVVYAALVSSHRAHSRRS